VTGPFAIRPEEAGDHSGIRAVHRAAFGGPAQAALVDALREAGDLVLALVAAAGGPVGHVAFPRLTIEGGGARVVALAPLAVLPDWHGCGVGTGLVKAGLNWLREAGEDLVMVRATRPTTGASASPRSRCARSGRLGTDRTCRRSP
jgi:putative acetyltransferase